MIAHRTIVLDPVDPGALLAAATAGAGPVDVSSRTIDRYVRALVGVTAAPNVTTTIYYPAADAVESYHPGLGYHSWYALLVIVGPRSHPDDVGDIRGAAGLWLNLRGYRYAYEALDGTYRVMPRITAAEIDAVDAPPTDPGPYTDWVAPHGGVHKDRRSRLRTFLRAVLCHVVHRPTRSIRTERTD